MKLENKLLHMRGKSVLVNGTIYKIDKEGFSDITKKEDAEKLLASKAWVDPVTVKEAKKTDKPKSKKEGFLVIEDKSTGERSTVVKPDKIDELNKPNQDTSISELKELADMLGVKYRANTPKSTLLDKVLAKMEE